MSNPMENVVGLVLAIAVMIVVLLLFLNAGHPMNWPYYILCEWVGAENYC